MNAYYNEFDPKAAAWLREVIKAGHIAPGDVDERSITDVHPDDLKPYTQCHFFAGIGGWSLALRLAGWADEAPVWTGSCPYQPFSVANTESIGEEDPRHLWPAFAKLINARQPSVVFGEQVASKDGRFWLSGVFADLEAMGYHRAAADLCAAGVGAPHIRQRLYWLAYANYARPQRRRRAELRERADQRSAWTSGDAGRVADSDGERFSQRSEQDSQSERSEQQASRRHDTLRCGGAGGMEHPESDGREQRWTKPGGGSIASRCGWSDFDVLPFRDGKFRRVESGTFPLAHGVPERVGLLRGYGNAIVAPLAAEFIAASIEAIEMMGGAA